MLLDLTVNFFTLIAKVLARISHGRVTSLCLYCAHFLESISRSTPIKKILLDHKKLSCVHYISSRPQTSLHSECLLGNGKPIN
jgi:hypothetical protein